MAQARPSFDFRWIAAVLLLAPSLPAVAVEEPTSVRQLVGGHLPETNYLLHWRRLSSGSLFRLWRSMP